jgi:hypothetical protein
MATNRVHVGSHYFYKPNLLDIVDGRTNLKDGDEVVVVNLHGAPKANTMGHCHINKLDGSFGGLVHCNSLHTKAEYKAWLIATIAKIEESKREGAR